MSTAPATLARRPKLHAENTRARRDPRPTSAKLAGAGLTTITWFAVPLLFFAVFWMIKSGFETEAEAETRPPTFYFKPMLEQFANIVDRGVGPDLINPLVVALAAVVALAIPAAYALSMRPVGKWSDVLFFFLSTWMLPVAAAIAPISVLAQTVHLLDTVAVLISLNLVANLFIAIWMVRSFMVEIPRDVLEAARVDGAGFVHSMAGVIMPMLAPGIGAFALICFIFVWDEFCLAVNLTSTVASTLPVFLVGFITSEGQFWAQLSAAGTVCAVPVIAAGWIAQDKPLRGLTLGAVK